VFYVTIGCQKNCLYGTKDSLEIVFLKQRTEQRCCNVGWHPRSYL